MFFETLQESQKALIQQHLELVLQANENVNLTRIVSEDEAFLLHIEDSLSALSEMDKAPSGLYGDLGSGGGFPGIPLAIATGRETYLIDARKKKMEMVQAIINELGLEDQIHTYTGRAELLARKMPAAFSVLTARALAKLPVLLELASPLLKSGGFLICYKSHVECDELQAAEAIKAQTGMSLISDRSFTLESYDRRILTYKKVSKPTIKLPRTEGAAQKHPLS